MTASLLTEPAFYFVSIPAVLLYGVAKGGFGGAIAMVSVPLMALAMAPTQAAAILLPILVLMDALVVKAYWGVYDRRALQVLLPGAVVGVAVGYLTADAMNDAWMRVLVGLLAVAFAANYFFGRAEQGRRDHNPVAGTVFGTLAGFTSFSIHAGGPPFTVYLLPRGLSPLLFAGTAGLFFAAVNLLKLVPYYFLGQFNSENLLYSLILVPLAPVGVWLGRYLVQRSDPKVYYGIISGMLGLLGCRLLWQGAAQLLSGP